MLNFVDCPNCRKRVRENAQQCHHCGAQFPDGAVQDSEQAQGGYDDANDDFDYDEFVENEFGNGGSNKLPKIWIYTAWILLFAVLVPIALSVIALMTS